jgi:hypothetical protein
MNIRKSRIGRIAVATAVVLAAGVAQAATVTLTDDERSVGSSGNVSSSTSSVSWTRNERPATDYAAFTYTVDETRNAGTNVASGEASLDSLATTSLLQGTGTTTASAVINQTGSSNDYNYYSRAEVDGFVTYRISFQVLQPTEFDLSAVLSIVGAQNCCGNSAQLSLRNTNYNSPTFNLSFGNSSSGPFTQNVALSGILDPNTYTLEAIARASADAYSLGVPALNTASFDFALMLGPQTSPVPLPGSVWLLGTAVGAIAARRRFRKAA